MATGVPLADHISSHVIAFVVVRSVVPAAWNGAASIEVALGGGMRIVAAGWLRNVGRTW